MYTCLQIIIFNPLTTNRKKTMASRILRDQGRVLIDGVTPWRPADMIHSAMAAQATAMFVVGIPIDYTSLMGASGSAFRIQFHVNWCPSSSNPFCGRKTVAGMVDALPFEVTAHEVKADDEDGKRRVRALVHASIDRGFPCPYGNEEDGLIIGYPVEGNAFLCLHPYHQGDQPFEETAWPWGIVTYGDKKNPPPDKVRILKNSLELAVELSKHERTGDYACGFHAWSRWIDALRDDDAFREGSRESLLGAQMANAWIFRSLVDARIAAERYLRASTRLLTDMPKASEALEKGANHFEGLVRNVLCRENPLSVAPPPRKPGKGPAWDRNRRHAQADLLAEGMEIEKEALHALAAARDALID